MTTQFLSRVSRTQVSADVHPQIGPGSYDYHRGAMAEPLPAFAPFASTTKRMPDIKPEGSTSSYNVSQDLVKRSDVASSFKSKSHRFKPFKQDDAPGPGDYVLQSAISYDKPKQFPKRSANSAVVESLVPTTRQPPSIPTKFQSYGYESGPDGHLELQEPLNPGYTGKGLDRVGPGDYNPRGDLKFSKAPRASMKGPEREQLDRLSRKLDQAPGPGYYNTQRSEFDVTDPSASGGDSTDFIVRLNNIRKRQSSVFESKTDRNSMLKPALKRMDEPGPGRYNLPSSINVVKKDPSVQHFSSSTDRFADEMPRSMRIHTAPGSYDPITSDFDKLRLRVLKQKKMHGRSAWAQNVAFTSTESRFGYAEAGYDNQVPPPSAYLPKTSIADSLPKQNVRGGGFGARDPRFKEKPSENRLSKEQKKLAEINAEIASFLSQSGGALGAGERGSGRGGAGGRLSPPAAAARVRHSSVFASTAKRFRTINEKEPGPAPWAYDVQPRWDEKGSAVMAPNAVRSRKIPDKMPGPGDYHIPRHLGKARFHNPKNIMLGTESREVRGPGSIRPGKWELSVPGPGNYDPKDPVKGLGGGMLRPSFNVYLSNSYYDPKG